MADPNEDGVRVKLSRRDLPLGDPLTLKMHEGLEKAGDAISNFFKSPTPKKVEPEEEERIPAGEPRPDKFSNAFTVSRSDGSVKFMMYDRERRSIVEIEDKVKKSADPGVYFRAVGSDTDIKPSFEFDLLQSQILTNPDGQANLDPKKVREEILRLQKLESELLNKSNKELRKTFEKRKRKK